MSGGEASGLHTTVVVNPAAGGGRAGSVWRELRAATPELAGAVTLEAADAESCRRQLAQALQRGTERVLVVGGDGTAHLAVNVLLAEDFGDQVAFGLVPAGTGSDLARSLGLASRPAAALRQVLAAEPRAIDALRVTPVGETPRYVVNIASAGLSGAVVPAVNANPRRGHLTYLSTTLSALLRYRPVACRIEVDGEPFADDAPFHGGFFLAAFANGQYFGKGMRVAPQARIDDGPLSVVVIPPVPLWHLPYRMPQFLTGRHVTLPIVRTARARRVRLTPAAGFPPFDVDGESLPAGPAEIHVLPSALRVLAPASKTI
ncbi:MAG: diacylglycerol kinase family protein [Acidobacteriota bacterium]